MSELSEIQLPDEKELAKLSRISMGAYAARCALRALPTTVVGDELSKWGTDFDRNMRCTEMAVLLASLGPLIEMETVQDIISDVSIGMDDIVAKANARSAFVAVAEALHAVDEKGDINTMAGSAEKASVASRAAIGKGSDDQQSAHDMANRAAMRDLMVLMGEESNPHSVFNSPLWPKGEPDGWFDFLRHWDSALNDNGLGEIVSRYQGFLDGRPDWESCKEAVNHWYSEYGGEEGSEEDRRPIEEQAKQPEGLQFGASGSATLNMDGAALEDHLGRDVLVKALCELLDYPDYSGRLTIGLMGHWGSGKSSVLKMLEKALTEKDKEKNKFWEPESEFIYAEFNAWAYEHTDNIQAGLAQEVVNGLTGGLNIFQKLLLASRLAIMEHPWRFLYTFFVVAITGTTVLFYQTWFDQNQHLIAQGGLTALIIGMLVSIVPQIKQMVANPMAKQLQTYLRLPEFGSYLGALPVIQRQVHNICEIRLNTGQRATCRWPGPKRRFLFVVDDLDRCGVKGIVETLEAVRLVMDLESVTVIIAIDHRMALAALTNHYYELSEKGSERTPQAIARDYLGKIFQVPILLDEPLENIEFYVKKSLFNHLLHSGDERKTNIGNDSDSGDSADEIDGTGNDSDSSDSADEIDGTGNDSDSGDSTDEVDGTGNDSDSGDGIEEGMNIKEKATSGVMEDSQDELNRFVHLAKGFDIANPRQLKRLHNCYRLLKGYEWHCRNERRSFGEETWPDNLVVMTMLFWLEFLYNCEWDKREWEEKNLLEGFDNEDSGSSLNNRYYDVGHQNRLLNVLHDTFFVGDKPEASYFTLKHKVEPFMLPFAERKNSDTKKEAEVEKQVK